MLNRRTFLTRSASLLALGPLVPQFVASTARAAEAGKKDTVLVVVELTGGNDGLNTVIPYADDLYHKARPTLGFTKAQVVRLDDHVGLHPGMRSFEKLFKDGHLAVVQGVGYPNPDRSHFESMDVWHSADPRRKTRTGWLGRSAADLLDRKGGLPLLHVGGGRRLPLALQGAAGGAVSVNDQQAYRLDLGGGSDERHQARRKLLDELARPAAGDESLGGFVRRQQVSTLTSLEQLQAALAVGRRGRGYFSEVSRRFYQANSLPVKLQLVAELIARGFGTRVFYVNLEGFDTHSGQATPHQNLLAELADGVAMLFNTLKQSKNDRRVRVLTFSEFGRRVKENGSKGTDHGAGSCLFVAGPSLKGGVVGAHPSLKDLDSGDLKYHTDFRRVYATLLDHWLGCDSKTVLGGTFEALDALKAKA
jgi:uncharacterized protein (DUF1501 family)